MYCRSAVAIGVLLLVYGCGRGPAPQDAQPASGGATPASQASGATQSAASAPRADATKPLGEFEPLTPTDVDLYLKVMRAAAERLRTLPESDRAALKLLHDMSTGKQAPGQVPTPDQIVGMQRGGELMAMDNTVAREMGVATRYRSIAGRVPTYEFGEMTGEGDDEPMTAEQKAALKVRIEKFRQLKAADRALLDPHHDEILALQKQVNLVMHPENIPK